MPKNDAAEFTSAAGRRFGLTVGAAFLVFAAIASWRAHPDAATVLGALGGLLAAAGLLIPAHLGPVERGWMALAHLISRVTTPVVMGLMYLLVLSPVGALRRSLGGNPLVHVERDGSFWQPRAAGARRSASMQRQF